MNNVMKIDSAKVSKEQMKNKFDSSSRNHISKNEVAKLARRLHKIKRRLLLDIANANQGNNQDVGDQQ